MTGKKYTAGPHESQSYPGIFGKINENVFVKSYNGILK